jgi:hypothetical protein
MVNLAVTKHDILSAAEVSRQRVTATVPFRVAREKFSNWYHLNVSPDINWEEPMICQMFHAWIAGSGVTEWRTDEDIAERERKKASMAAAKEKRNKLKEEGKYKGRKK